MLSSDDIKVVVDLGSSQIRVAIIQIDGKHNVEIISFGTAEHRGMRQGMIIDMSMVSNALKTAIGIAEQDAGVKVNSAIFSISSDELFSLNSEADITLKFGYVSKEDIREVNGRAKALAEKSTLHMLHALHQQFYVDEHQNIVNPLEMIADKLGVSLHIIELPQTVFANLAKCAALAGIEVEYGVFNGLASSQAVLDENDKDLGCCLIDIGQSSTNFMVWKSGMPVMSGMLPLGGDAVSSDLALVLNIPPATAEILKCDGAGLTLVHDAETVSVPATGVVGERTFIKNAVNNIVRERYAEIFDLILKQLHRAGYKRSIYGGLVLTGGGAQMNGLVEFLEQSLGVSAKLGVVQCGFSYPDLFCSNHSFSTLLGMIELATFPINDVIWEKTEKKGIISKIKSFFS